jgi:adenine-specific DNA-methyltransferase
MNNFTPHHPAQLPEDIKAWARELRGSMTDAEALLWKFLRNRRMASAKFRRQHPIGRYILDFYCDEKRLCIEIDGSQHVADAGYDARRDAWLLRHGIRVLRFWNNQVLTETESVLEVIYDSLMLSASLSSLIPAPSPASGRREQKK